MVSCQKIGVVRPVNPSFDMTMSNRARNYDKNLGFHSENLPQYLDFPGDVWVSCRKTQLKSFWVSRTSGNPVILSPVKDLKRCIFLPHTPQIFPGLGCVRAVKQENGSGRRHTERTRDPPWRGRALWCGAAGGGTRLRPGDLSSPRRPSGSVSVLQSNVLG